MNVVLISRDHRLGAILTMALSAPEQLTLLDSAREVPDRHEAEIDAVVLDLPADSRRDAYDELRQRYEGRVVVPVDNARDTSGWPPDSKRRFLVRPFQVADLIAGVQEPIETSVAERAAKYRRRFRWNRHQAPAFPSLTAASSGADELSDADEPTAAPTAAATTPEPAAAGPPAATTPEPAAAGPPAADQPEDTDQPEPASDELAGTDEVEAATEIDDGPATVEFVMEEDGEAEATTEDGEAEATATDDGQAEATATEGGEAATTAEDGEAAAISEGKAEAATGDGEAEATDDGQAEATATDDGQAEDGEAAVISEGKAAATAEDGGAEATTAEEGDQTEQDTEAGGATDDTVSTSDVAESDQDEDGSQVRAEAEDDPEAEAEEAAEAEQGTEASDEGDELLIAELEGLVLADAGEDDEAGPADGEPGPRSPAPAEDLPAVSEDATATEGPPPLPVQAGVAMAEAVALQQWLEAEEIKRARQRRRLVLANIAAGLVLLLIGVVLGRAIGPDQAQQVATPTTASQPATASTVPAQAPAPAACTAAMDNADQVISYLVAKIRDERLSKSIQEYGANARACRTTGR